MLSMRQQRGFTLIEIVIALAIIGIMVLAGIPVFRSWSQNMQIRSSAESTLNGLQYARAEALRRNTSVRFQLTSTADNSCAISTGQVNWVVNLGTALGTDPSGACGGTITPTINQYSGTSYSPYLLQVYNAIGATGVSVASSGTTANMLVVFGPLGQIVYPTTDTQWVFSNPTAGTCATSSTSGVVCMQVVASVNGRIRMCNPILPAGSPQGC